VDAPFLSFVVGPYRLRLERIKRNQERLAQLGLQSMGGMLGRRSSSHKRKSTSSEPTIEKRRTLSRTSKQKEVDYSGVLDIRVLMGEKKKKKTPREKAQAKDETDKPRKEKKSMKSERYVELLFMRWRS
jgi:hypothetical protein